MLRQAMLEERSRLTARTPEGLAGRVFGAVEVEAARVVRGTPESAERALLEWMERNELLVVQRQQPGRISWEKLTGVQAAMRRGMSTFEGARPRYMLARADVVRATVTPLEDGYCHVSLSASLRGARSSVAAGTGFLAGSGVVAGGVLAVLGAAFFVPLVPVIGGAALGWAVSRRHRPVAERTQLGLERALDYVEGHAVKPGHELPARGPGILDMIAGEVRKAIASGSPSSRQRPPRRP
jgi:Flp pilus assembly protein TadB